MPVERTEGIGHPKMNYKNWKRHLFKNTRIEPHKIISLQQVLRRTEG